MENEDYSSGDQDSNRLGDRLGLGSKPEDSGAGLGDRLKDLAKWFLT